MQIKAWMIDAARLPEPLDEYRRVIDRCAEWGLNAILFRLADDQGAAMRFNSHPELSTHAHAYTPAELADLARYAAGRGVELIPEIEAFGHTGYITRSPLHANLRDDDPTSGSPYTGIIPTHPQALTLLGDLFCEAAEVFPSRYLHAGCDEVNWGGSDFSRQAIADHTGGRAGVWTDHLNALNHLATESGKELMIWGDHVLGGTDLSGEILAGLERDIILVDWNYWDSDPSRTDGLSPRPGPIESAARRALEHGFCVVGAPAWGWCRWGVRAGESQLHNIDAYADIYRTLSSPPEEDSRCLGVIVTCWVPTRFLPGAVWDGLAYAGAALNGGSAAARQGAFRRLVETHYGSVWNETWADMFRTLYNITPARRACSAAWMAPFQPPLWASTEDLRTVLENQAFIALDLPFSRLQSQLAQLADLVRCNAGDFAAFRLSVDFLAWLHQRCRLLFEARSQPGPIPVYTLARELAEGDARMLAALEQAWDRCRFVDDVSKTERLPALRVEDQPLLALRLAATFTAWLAQHPGEFEKKLF